MLSIGDDDIATLDGVNVAQQAAAAGAVFTVGEETARAALSGRHVAGVTGQEVARCATQPVTLALPILTTHTVQSVQLLILTTYMYIMQSVAAKYPIRHTSTP